MMSSDQIKEHEAAQSASNLEPNANAPNAHWLERKFGSRPSLTAIEARRAPCDPPGRPGRKAQRVGVFLGDQSPAPGSGLKYFSYLPSSPLCSSASGGLSFFRVMFGHCSEKVALSSSHFS